MHNNKKQINKDSDGNPKTEKHLSLSRLNFIWDSKRKYSKSIRRIIEKYIFSCFARVKIRSASPYDWVGIESTFSYESIGLLRLFFMKISLLFPWKVKEKFKSIKQTNETKSIWFNYFTTNNFSRQFASIHWAEFSLIKIQENTKVLK